MTPSCVGVPASRAETCSTALIPSTRIGIRIAHNTVFAFARDHRVDLDIAQFHGLRLVAPFVTDSVVRACLAVPVQHRTSAFAVKPLLRTALDQHVPAPVLDRSTKGDYTALHYAGLAHNADYLRGLLADSHLVDSGLLDIRHASSVLNRAVHGADVPLAALNDVIATEVWFRTEAARSRVPWITREDTADDAPLPARRPRHVHTDA